MKNMPFFRPGPTGAMLDEYQRAVAELNALLLTLSESEFITLSDPETEDPDCRSVQTIMNHVVRAGYGYANQISKKFNIPFTERKENYQLTTPVVAVQNMVAMMAYTEQQLASLHNLTFAQVLANRFEVPWGQVYDYEQMLEHAIVHILRHRRQIERLRLALRNP